MSAAPAGKKAFLFKPWAWCVALLPVLAPAQPVTYVQQRTADGVLEGVVSGDGLVRTFKGIPYAAPPVGPLRWQPPQPVKPWTGVRRAVDYGPRAMQGRIYDDMVFRDNGPSEDCLYLNLWMPGKPATGKLPVMVWIHGGGFVAGSSSEPRQDGGNLCQEGVLVVSMNYRMGVFGFFAHPELTRESPHHASGNYGLLDIVAALRWVHDNIATFGGDPDNVTIFGESAGSSAVSALMASPLARGLFQKAIGESGALFNDEKIAALPRAAAEQADVRFAGKAFGTSSLAALRAIPAAQLLAAALREPQDMFGPDVDGWFLPENCSEIYAAGRQARVPLLAGWNRDEGSDQALLQGKAPTLTNYVAAVQARFGGEAADFLRVYGATDDTQARRAAADFGCDLFSAFGMWQWTERHRATGGQPVWRYEFDQALPLPAGAKPGTEPTAYHSAEIEYIFRVLASKNLPFGPADHQVSELMASYWTNFAKTGNPNGLGLPGWPSYDAADRYQVMHLKPDARARPDAHRTRYGFLEQSGLGQSAPVE